MTRTSSALAAAVTAALSLATPALAGDFAGPYVGGALSAGFNAPVVPDWEGSAFVGFNFDFGSQLIAGGELDLTYNPNSLWDATSAATTTLDGRVGYLVSDEVMVYGRAGGGYTSGADGSYVWDVGAGAEYMLHNGMTVRGELDRVDPFEDGMDTQINGRLGVVLNF